MQNVNSISVTIPNPSVKQLSAIVELLDGAPGSTSVTSTAPLGALATKGKTKKGGATSKPAKTVSKDEDEDFGEKELDEEDVADEDEKDEVDEDEKDEVDEEEEESEDEDEPALSFDDVRTAMNTLGENHPDDMTAILNSFNIKNTKELQKHKSKWEPVYRKTMLKIKKYKAAKKSKR